MHEPGRPFHAAMHAVALGLCAIVLSAPAAAWAEPTTAQTFYWWQDEIRAAAFDLSIARTGQVAEWPRMTVAAGTMTLPLPPAAGPITADGRLDEPAWQQATQFPVGPVFDDWRRGPMMLEVSICRDEKNLYLAIESPRDLTGLGSLGPDGEVFRVGETPYPAPAQGGRVVELALPWTDNVTGEGTGPFFGQSAGSEESTSSRKHGPVPLRSADVTLTFRVEMLRHVDGKLPPEANCLGLPELATPGNHPFRSPTLWLEPITVRLTPANSPVRLSEESLKQSLKPSRANESSGVLRYTWQAALDGKTFTAEGFFYREPIAATVDATRQMLRRSAALRSTKLAEAPSDDQLAAVLDEAKQVAPDNRDARRALYCRARELRARAHLSMLDAPLLFVKQHPYFAAHIYDDYYPWHPGGGIYVIERPHDPGSEAAVRPLIDPTTNETLGPGVYRDPDVSWDADRILFVHKPAADAVTSIYEIGIDGRGLRRLTASEKHYDIMPAYLPDGRIVFTSTRPGALVPCFNSGVNTLHVMNADGSDLHSISYNNVTEFDPSVMPDGRVLYGRWEYVDKTALYMQSLWTMSPDGRMEEAYFANNLARPTAILDARPVPGSNRVIASLTPHNGQPAGAIATIDIHQGKNNLDPVVNFTPEFPVRMDQGLVAAACDAWPLSEDDSLFSNNAIAAHGIVELADRFGHRELVCCDPAISCYAPMLVKPRPRPAVVSPATNGYQPGRFLLVDVYQGLTGVERGTIKRLRILEETARTSGLPPGGRWWNQAFLVSWQGAYIVKNILGTVPVYEDGSAYFEVPPGRAIYFEALDAEGREIQRMRSFVQGAPGTTRSCVGCHENKQAAPVRPDSLPIAMLQPPARPEPESWGSGFLDYPTMVQPVLDKYCVRCHGGREGINHGLDFSGGWTWAFNISYETLIKNRMVGFLNCENGSVHTSQLLRPRAIGSGASSLAEILIKRHPEMSRDQRDLVLAWMDTNSNYYGSWDYTPFATCDAIFDARGPLSEVMRGAGCTDCHAPGHIGNDWINLQSPEFSRILRAPMAKTDGGLGVAFCRNRKARAGYPLVNQSVQPPDVLLPSKQPPWDPSGEAHVTFASTDNVYYREMLDIIRRTRTAALARPRVDMPGAEVVPGECRQQIPMPVPDTPPALAVRLRPDDAVELSWPRTARTIGLQYELHRGATPDFTPNYTPEASTQIGLTTAGRFLDLLPPIGTQYYALIVSSGTQRSRPVYASLDVPQPPTPDAPVRVAARALPGEIALSWEAAEAAGLSFDVYRRLAGEGEAAPLAKLNPQPLRLPLYSDGDVEPGRKYAYTIRAVDRRGQESSASDAAEASPLAEIQSPVFVADFADGSDAVLLDGSTAKGQLHGGAKVVRRGSHVRRGSPDPAETANQVRRGSPDPAVTANQVRRGSPDPAVTANQIRRGSPDPAVTPDRQVSPPPGRPSVGAVARSGDRPQQEVGAVARSGDRPQQEVGTVARSGDRPPQGGAIEFGDDGFATFGHLPEFDLGRAISVECWVWIDRESPMPVVLSCGEFNGAGWFVQRYGGGWRWHLGGISCDGGQPATGRWVHLVGTYNGSQARLYQDGRQVAAVDCYPNAAPYGGPLVVGQYSGQSPQYQTLGRMTGVKIYRRALKAEEIAAKFAAGVER